jgi:hypothetical protein
VGLAPVATIIRNVPALPAWSHSRTAGTLILASSAVICLHAPVQVETSQRTVLCVDLRVILRASRACNSVNIYRSENCFGQGEALVFMRDTLFYASRTLLSRGRPLRRDYAFYALPR